MSNLTINTNTSILTKAIALASNYLSKDGQFAGQVILSGKDGVMNVKSTDNVETIKIKDISFTTNDMTIDNFEEIALDAKKLLKVLKALKGENVSLELESSKVTVKSNRSKVKLDLYEEVQHIEVSSNGETISLNLDNNLIEGFNHVAHAIDSNNSKYELNGCLIKTTNNKMQIVSTDSRRLPVATYEVTSEDFEVIIPKRGVASICKLFSGYNLTASILEDMIVVEAKNVSYSIRLINGKFPEFERIVPKTFKEEISLSRTLLIEMTEEASVLSEELVVDVSNNAITISDMLGDTEVSEELELNAEFRFGINAKNLIDFLNSTDEDTISMGFNESGLPIVFLAGNSYKEVLMPIIIATSTEELSNVA